MSTTYISEGDSATPAFMNTLLNAAGGDVFNVKASAYGAVVDGSTDDSAAIQAAIDACPDRGTIYIPPGTVAMSSGVTLDPTKSISFVGAGTQSRFLVKSDFSGSALFTAKGTDTNNRIVDINFANFQVQGATDSGVDPICFDTDFSNHMRMRNLWIVNLRNIAFKLKNAWDCSLDNVWSYACGQAGGTAWEISGSGGGLISNGIYMTGCRIERSFGIALKMTNTAVAMIAACKFHGRGTSDSNFADADELLYLDSATQIMCSATHFTQAQGLDTTSGAVRGHTTGNVSVTFTGCSFVDIADGTYAIYFTPNNSNAKLVVDGCMFTDVRAANKYIYLGDTVGARTLRIGPSNAWGAEGFEVEDATSASDTREYSSLLRASIGAGSQVFSGSGAPGSSTGSNGDFYFRDDGAGGTALYYKASGSWSAIA